LPGLASNRWRINTLPVQCNKTRFVEVEMRSTNHRRADHYLPTVCEFNQGRSIKAKLLNNCQATARGRRYVARDAAEPGPSVPCFMCNQGLTWLLNPCQRVQLWVWNQRSKQDEAASSGWTAHFTYANVPNATTKKRMQLTASGLKISKNKVTGTWLDVITDTPSQARRFPLNLRSLIEIIFCRLRDQQHELAADRWPVMHTWRTTEVLFAFLTPITRKRTLH